MLLRCRANGLVAQEQGIGDFLVALARRHEPEYLDLTGGQSTRRRGPDQ
jgi:hypothetical protein